MNYKVTERLEGLSEKDLSMFKNRLKLLVGAVRYEEWRRLNDNRQID